MKKLLYILPTGVSLTVASVLFTPVPAYAQPTCEQEILIRCSGHNFVNKGRLDIYYDTFEECVETETPAHCPGGPDTEMSFYNLLKSQSDQFLKV